jgi:hypothetical protein
MQHRGVVGDTGRAEAANNTISRYRSFYTSFQYKVGTYGTGTGIGTAKTLKNYYVTKTLENYYITKTLENYYVTKTLEKNTM